MNLKTVGDGKVVLIAGGGKCYTDIAARFVGSERSLEDILASPYDADIVRNILNRNHLAATEFDYFLFGIEGFARPTEIQLVRKRIASYLIKSGRKEKKGKRTFDIVIPTTIKEVETFVPISFDDLRVWDGYTSYVPINKFLAGVPGQLQLRVNTLNLLDWTEQWYNQGVFMEVPEEDLRYMKQQATEFKAIIGMNAHSLIDWFGVRSCRNAQTEIRDLANKMLKLCKQATPDLFSKAGARCVSLGYCPENDGQHKDCKKITHNEVLRMIKAHQEYDVG